MSVEITHVEQVKCKYCGSEAVTKYGAHKGVPRYFCKVCRRKFKADDNLAGMRVPISKLASALDLYYDGTSVRAIGRHFQVEGESAPSTASIYEWVQRYSQYLTESTKDYHPKGIGSEWVADETVLTIAGTKVWLWDISDTRTRFLLASRLATSRTTRDAQLLIDRAVKAAGEKPARVLTDQLASYLDVDYGKDAEHVQGSPFSKVEGESTSKIERWHGTLKSRTKVMRGLKNLETANDFTQTYQAYYNYLRPHEALDHQTPASVAGVSYPYKNWAEVIRNYRPAHKIEITHVERGSLPLRHTQIGRPHKPFRVTPKMPPITKQWKGKLQ